ncbi:HAD-superfamily hydrolase, subfamily IA, variant 1 [Minicystis rosea]|nr:HAD-superfamily hydrolase, subfamily IA, variant 1 [Minicystis rosea]
MVDAVLLDVDGTLIDSNSLHVLAWSRAFRRIGREIPIVTIAGALGMGGDRLVPALLGDIDDETAERARTFHGEEFGKRGLIHHAEPLPGARALIEALHARGVRTALASSSKRDELDHYRKLLGVEVDVVVAKEDVPATKPSPHLFAVALARLGHPARAVVIGDTIYDIEAASRLDLPCVAVLTGGIPRETLTGAGAAAIYESTAAILTDLPRSLDR